MLTPAHARSLVFIAAVFAVAAGFDGLVQLLALCVVTVAYALTWEPPQTDVAPRYRLEHRRPDQVHVLAVTGDEAAGRAALEAQAVALAAAGTTGQLVLVDRTRGAAVTWRVLGPRPAAPTA